MLNAISSRHGSSHSKKVLLNADLHRVSDGNTSFSKSPRISKMGNTSKGSIKEVYRGMPKTANQDSKLDLITNQQVEETLPTESGRNGGFRRVCISKTNVLAPEENEHVKVQDENQT